MIFAYLFPYNAHAKGLVFRVDPGISKPKVIYRPYANEFKKTYRKTTTKKQSKVPDRIVKNETPTSDSERNYSSEEIQALIVEYSKQYGISPNAPLCIAKHESGFNPNAKNKHSTASGIFQYLQRTWKKTDEGRIGQSVFNAEANIKAAIKYMASRKSTSPWISTAKNCPKLSFL